MKTRSYSSVVVPGPNPKVTCTTPPVDEGLAVTVSVVHSGSWPPPSGSGALGTPSTSCLICASECAVNGHDAKTSGPLEPASHVVYIASPAQFAGVHAGEN